MTEKDDIVRRLHGINSKLRYYDYVYHTVGSSVVPDSEYDDLLKKKNQLLLKNPSLRSEDNYRDIIGSSPDSKFRKVKHMIPMLSLDKAFEIADLQKFFLRFKKASEEMGLSDCSIVCEPKIDGLSVSLIYINGSFAQASTRGDGYFGEEITKNVKTIKGLPQTIESAPDFLEVRGEIYLDHATFLKINKDKEFSNPRNAVAGSVRHLDSSIAKNRNLKYFAYSIVDSQHSTQEEILTQLREWNFIVNDHSLLMQKIEDVVNYYNLIYDKRAKIGYDIDGIVCKVNSISIQNKLGVTSHSPRWAIAYKFPSLEGKTILKKISIQVGRTGVLTPIADLVPINIGGVIVSRASLHNKNEIERKDIREGDYVVVKRAGDVIPQIVSVDFTLRPKEGLQKFYFPELCPICKSKLRIDSDEIAIRCTGDLFCSSQIIERIEHFVSRDGLNIIGLSKKQIEFLYSENMIVTPVDIFKLKSKLGDEKIFLDKFHGWGKKSVNNLLKSIEVSRNTTLDRFIFALGIRFIGKNTSYLIASEYLSYNTWYVSMLDLVSKGTEGRLSSIHGLGIKAIESLKKFFSESRNVEMINELSAHLRIADCEKGEFVNNGSEIFDKTVVFTGVLSKMSRSEAKKRAEKLGAKVVSNVSSNIDFLVVGEKPGSKYEEARKLGINIITENQWLKIIDIS